MAALVAVAFGAVLAATPAHATKLTQRGELELQGPGLDVSIGGVGLGGLGTESGGEGRPLSVAIGGRVRAAYLYWGGRGVLPGDDSILVDGMAIEGELIGSEPAPAATSFAYRADVTAMVRDAVDPPAMLTLVIDDPTPDAADSVLDGASLLVVFDDLTDPTPYHLSVFDGSDFAWAPNLPGDAGFTETVQFITVPEDEDRLADLIVVAGDAFPTRPDRILISDHPTIVDELDASDGLQWDSDRHEITIPADQSRLSVQLVSPPEAGPAADSMNWILAVLRRPVQGSTDGFTGACCLEGGVCVVVSVEGCNVLGGLFQGPSTTCDPDPCPDPTGACCLPDGSCRENTEAGCQSAGGTYQGDDTQCGSVDCPEPMGACCFRDGTCGIGEAFDCLVAGGTYQGDGVQCDQVQCSEPTGACCLADGSCVEDTAAGCQGAGGVYQGDDVACGSVSCPQPTGACCLADGSCVEDTAAGCQSAGGAYQGDDVACGSVSCPPPTGACCLPDGSCINLREAMCTAIGGDFQGAGSSCAQVDCPLPTGACCLPNGSCSDGTEAACDSAGGDYQGDDTTCGQTSCPQPIGACCLDNGACLNATQVMCEAMGGTFQGDGTSCATVSCPQPTGACCLADGSCVEVTEDECDASSGTYQGDFTACGSVSCPQPTGACCLADGSCVEVTEDECDASNGAYQGDFTACGSVSCPQPTGACCLADGSCVEVTEDECDASNGAYQGDFTACGSVSCPQPTGACCLVDGSCVESTEDECDASSGAYQGDFTTCGSVSCPQPTGACCLDDGTCIDVTETQCLASSGVYEGDFTDCGDVQCPQPMLIGACCLSDGSCVVVMDDECTEQGGRFQGDGTDCGSVECLRPTGGGCSEKGSLLVFSHVEVRYDENGRVLRDTFIDLSNDFPQDVRVLMYFVNGDAPLPKCKDGATAKDLCDDRYHPGWNWVDNEIMLTKNEPTYWSAATGQPKGVSPWSVLDPGDPVGRPAGDGTTDRVIRGYILVWAIDVEGREIRWNHLKGDAVVVDYARTSAWEYNACGYQVVDPTVANGEQTGTPGTINLDGAEYAPVYDMLLLDFYASGASPFRTPGDRDIASVETGLTLHAMDNDLRQETDGPVTTKAHFDIWNMNEVKFSGTYRCVTCWDGTMLRDYGIPNHFLRSNLQTDKGKARIDGLRSMLCDVDNDPKDQLPLGAGPNDVVSRDAALAGVAWKYVGFGPLEGAAAGTNLHGMGTESAVVRFDTLSLPPEATEPKAILDELLEMIREQLRPGGSR